MAEDDSSTSDPAVTERPSAAAGLIILVGPDQPGGRRTGSGPTGGRRAGSGLPGGRTRGPEFNW